MSKGYTLYGRAGSGSVAPQLILEELGIPYEVVWVDQNAAAEPAYRRICPTGKVPALVLPDGSAIFESAAICIHLTDAHSGSGLAPAPGTASHARYLQWMLFLATSLYDAALRIYYAQRYTAGGDREGVKAAAISEFERHLALVEQHLPNGGLLGDAVSAADLYLFMLAGWHPEGDGAVRERFPRIGALCARIAARPVVQRVMATNAG
jgi:glutathione S-transferase